MQKKKVYEDPLDKYLEDESGEETNEETDSELEEITPKKRGPKRKGIKKNINTTFKLDDSDIERSIDNDIEILGTETPIENHQKSTLNTPWIEKYRPTKVHDLVLDDNTQNKIKKIVEDKRMPNIIITGVPGIGKTTTILCIAKNLLGKYYKEGVLELNASDERGVKTVQESIEYFCKKRLIIDNKLSKHKIVLLDEADNMTKKAQQSINILMEQYKDTTRFAFTCNNSSEIIEAIQSRCIIFRYGRLNNIQITNRLKKICENESVPYTEEGLNSIVTTAQGDLRQAINNLQLTFNGYNNVIPDNVYKLCDKPHPLAIQNIFIACKNKDIKTALKILTELHNKGYSSSDISFSMLNTLKNINKDILNEQMKINYMNEVSNTCLIISKGVNTLLQLTGCVAALCKQ